MKNRSLGRRVLAIAAVLGAVSCGSGAGRVAAVNDRAEVEAWRAQHEKDYREEYVVLGGLFFLNPGANSAGSGPSNDVVLPGRAPASIGRFVLNDGAVTFEPAEGAGATVAGTTGHGAAAPRRRSRPA